MSGTVKNSGGLHSGLEADARVGDHVQDVRQQDAGERKESAEREERHHQRDVAAAEREHGKRAHAGDVEDIFDQDAAGHQPG